MRFIFGKTSLVFSLFFDATLLIFIPKMAAKTTLGFGFDRMFYASSFLLESPLAAGSESWHFARSLVVKSVPFGSKW